MQAVRAAASSALQARIPAIRLASSATPRCLRASWNSRGSRRIGAVRAGLPLRSPQGSSTPSTWTSESFGGSSWPSARRPGPASCFPIAGTRHSRSDRKGPWAEKGVAAGAFSSSAARGSPADSPSRGQWQIACMGAGVGNEDGSAAAAGDVVEVVRSNFKAMLPRVLQALEACDFVAFDGEFTGLHPERDPAAAARIRRMEVLDDLELRYERVQAAAHNFLIMQLGLSAVKWEEAEGRFTTETFTFYLFPLPYKSNETHFLCQASSLHFLAENGFDFNKFVYQGIPYLSLDQLRRERRSLQSAMRREQQQQQRRGNGGGVTLAAPADRLFVGQQMDRVRAWVRATEPPPVLAPQALNLVGQQEGGGGGGAGGGDGGAPPGVPPVLVLEQCNGALRAALYQQMEEDFCRAKFYASTIYAEGSRGGSWARIQLLRASESQIAQLEEQRRQQQEAELEASAGFGLVVEALVGGGKPLVGHNCLLDLAYFSSQFLQPLPPSLDLFRSLVVDSFPGGVYDTKHLVTAPGVLPRALFPTGTSLGTVFTLCSQEASLALAPDSSRDKEQQQQPQQGGQHLRLQLHPASVRPPSSTLWELRGEDASPTQADRVADALPSEVAGSSGPSRSPTQEPQGATAQGAGPVLHVYLPPVVPRGEPQGSSGAGELAAAAEASGGEVKDASASAQGPGQDSSLHAVSHAHDAGYDALMTGTVFASLGVLVPALSCALSALGSFPGSQGDGAAAQDSAPRKGPAGKDKDHDQQEGKEAADPGPPLSGRPSLPFPPQVLEHMNLVNVYRCDAQAMPLTGPVPAPDRSATFLLSNIPSTATTFSLQDLFSRAGLGPTRIVWLDTNYNNNSSGNNSNGNGNGAAQGQQRQRPRQGLGAPGGGAGEQAHRRVVVTLWDASLGPAAARAMLDVAPSLCLTPWESIPQDLLQACLNGRAEWDKLPAAGGGEHAQPDVDADYARAKKAARTEGTSSCEIM